MIETRELFTSLDLRRQNLDEQIADRIQDLISTQQLQTGDRLPSERDLAAMLSVNRATVREAVQILQQRGLVEMRAGSGTYVVQVAPQVVGDAIERYFGSRECSQKELQEVRKVVEPEIAALAAENAQPPDLKRLSDSLAALEQAWASKDLRRMAAADAGFHLALASASHNDLFVAIVSGFGLVMQRWITAAYEREQAAGSLPQHRAVVEAIIARDSGAARAAMHHHMEMVPALDVRGGGRGSNAS